ncbi:hypothetical protein [Flavobacterium algicola]|uniref:hypothetical protein n=1 Tax=Flavobacterium algicola TaxID=556529 RepID=UPI001EFE8AD8|nr:hypothetical protein [Flavobacterium algicola]MCG9790920.1 hypothetical protein [Flavobacterium algicola]
MAFELKNVVPWGRSLNEYKLLFNLDDLDLNKKIISFGDGPASFNSEMHELNKVVISIDPIYKFSKKEIEVQITETKFAVIEQMKLNQDSYNWKHIKNIEELECIRMGAMNKFLVDFELGRNQKRYIDHELPELTSYDDLEFDIGLSSHFLILYSQLGLDFHLQAITEMLRVAKEVRIFPILNLSGAKSEVLDDILNHFSKHFLVNIVSCEYEFQKKGNQMVTIKRKL